jgi:hypothetical protein
MPSAMTENQRDNSRETRRPPRPALPGIPRNHRMFGRPRVISDGKYRCSSPQKRQATTIEWNGNSFTPAGTSRRQCLHATTNRFRTCITTPQRSGCYRGSDGPTQTDPALRRRDLLYWASERAWRAFRISAASTFKTLGYKEGFA